VIELQSTFYELPSLDLARKWRAQAPEGFRYCLKASQLITHEASSPTYRKRKTPLPERSRAAVGAFRDSEEVRLAWESTLAVAEALRAAVIVFQCPASFRPEEQNVRNLRRFFRSAGRRSHALAWEPRGNWPAELIRSLCAELDLIHCVDPFAADSVTQGARYYRLHGRGGYRYRYEDEELRQLAVQVGGKAEGATYVMFNNTNMWEDAARFLRLSGAGAKMQENRL
jgi:uncharacterized protein YecE (DUF72 family)